MRAVDPAVSGLYEVGPAVTGPCEVDPAVSGLCEVGPAETGLARSASCRSDGGLVLEPGRKRVVVRCCSVTVAKPVDPKAYSNACAVQRDLYLHTMNLNFPAPTQWFGQAASWSDPNLLRAATLAGRRQTMP